MGSCPVTYDGRVTGSAMGHHRRARAVRYALLVAVCQLSLALSASTVMLASTHTGVATVEAECSCDHSTAVMCPMHKRRAPRPLPPGTPRWCGAGDDSIFALLPVYGTLAAPEPLHRVLAPAATPRSFAPVSDRPVGLDSPPDSPPPRA